MTSPAGKKRDQESAVRETAIRLTEAQAKAVLSEVVHEVEALEDGEADTKLLKVVDDAIQSAEGRTGEAKVSAKGAKGAKEAKGGAGGEGGK